MMKRLTAFACIVATLVASALPAVAEAPGIFRVVLIGTSSPAPRPDRMGPATFVEAGSQRFLFDAGRGATIRLWQKHIPIGSLNAIFLTHYHSDHTEGLPDLWLTGYIPVPYGNRKGPLHVYGPPGLKALAAGLRSAYAEDRTTREADEHYDPANLGIDAHEFAHDGVVYQQEGVTVTAFTVDHGDEIKPADGYRIDYAGHSVVISGDTRPNENVVKYGTGVDVLVHEVAAVRPELANVPAVAAIMAHHTSAPDAGRIFTRAHPKMAVFTHIVQPSSATVPEVDFDEIVAQTRTTYAGPLAVGEDLMEFDIGDTVTVHPYVAPVRFP